MAKSKNLDLTKIKGIGGKRAETLAASGFATPSSLADARPETIASLLACSEKQAHEMIQAAQEFVKTHLPDNEGVFGHIAGSSPSPDPEAKASEKQRTPAQITGVTETVPAETSEPEKPIETRLKKEEPFLDQLDNSDPSTALMLNIVIILFFATIVLMIFKN